jgi:hypothetical protein
LKEAAVWIVSKIAEEFNIQIYIIGSLENSLANILVSAEEKEAVL